MSTGDLLKSLATDKTGGSNKEEKRRYKMTVHQNQGLHRSRRNRVLAGVCGGLAEFFGISAFWIRLAMLIAFIPGGVPGVFVYLVLWFVMPGE